MHVKEKCSEECFQMLHIPKKKNQTSGKKSNSCWVLLKKNVAKNQWRYSVFMCQQKPSKCKKDVMIAFTEMKYVKQNK